MAEEHDFVEVYINGEWETLHSYSWDPLDGAVVCRQLGYKGVNHTYSNSILYSFAAAAVPQHSQLSWLSCSGREANLLQCPQSVLDTTKCYHDTTFVARVVCTNEDLPDEGEYTCIPICA